MSGKAMANYYHEARAEKRAIKEKTEANKRKAERRAELAGVEVVLGFTQSDPHEDICYALAVPGLARQTARLMA